MFELSGQMYHQAERSLSFNREEGEHEGETEPREALLQVG